MTDWPYAFSRLGGKRVHLGVSGSIAAYKALDLLRYCLSSGMSVSATLTEAGARFVGEPSFQALGADPVYTAMFGGPEDTFGHLEPSRSSAAFAVVPATADILAKIAHGLADDMLSTQALAWTGPLILAPAMNPAMWRAAPTRENWDTLKRRGHVCIEPESGPVACGDEGQGRLADIRRVVAHLFRQAADDCLAGRRVLVSLGPTREHWDSVRFISNPSTGFMGASLAMAAWLRGAEVDVVAGPCQVWLPPEINRVDVTSASEMHQACMDLFPAADVAAMAAAVADFAPIPCGQAKFKKASMGEANLAIECAPVPDILAAMGKAKRASQFLVGFAAEAGDPEAEALRKLRAKNLDLIVANRIDRPGSGFASSTNTALVVARDGASHWWPEEPKPDMGWRIWDTYLGA